MLKRLLSIKATEYVSIDLSLLLLRVGAGGLILTHGLPKLFKIMEGDLSFVDPIGLGPELSLILAGISEGLFGFFILIGFATRIGAFFCAFTMAVAAFFQHADDPFSGKEKSLLFLLIFLFLFLAGPGKYSADRAVAKKRR